MELRNVEGIANMHQEEQGTPKAFSVTLLVTNLGLHMEPSD